jgi:hypothetical protein
MKVEDIPDTQEEEEEDPILTTFPAVKDECGVSCIFMCILLDPFHR